MACSKEQALPWRLQDAAAGRPYLTGGPVLQHGPGFAVLAAGGCWAAAPSCDTAASPDSFAANGCCSSILVVSQADHLIGCLVSTALAACVTKSSASWKSMPCCVTAADFSLAAMEGIIGDLTRMTAERDRSKSSALHLSRVAIRACMSSAHAGAVTWQHRCVARCMSATPHCELKCLVSSVQKTPSHVELTSQARCLQVRRQLRACSRCSRTRMSSWHGAICKRATRWDNAARWPSLGCTGGEG